MLRIRFVRSTPMEARSALWVLVGFFVILVVVIFGSRPFFRWADARQAKMSLEYEQKMSGLVETKACQELRWMGEHESGVPYDVLAACLNSISIQH